MRVSVRVHIPAVVVVVVAAVVVVVVVANWVVG